MTSKGKIPRPTIKRLSFYLRELEDQAEAGRATISSRQLGEALDLTDAQVRKDLAFFGQFGHPGVGYQVSELVAALRRILGTDRQWSSVVVGAGNIGRAVARYARMSRKGFEIVGVFDVDANVVGTTVGDHVVRPITELADVVRDRQVVIGMVAVPAVAAQEVADMLIDAGVRGILNFAPRRLNVSETVSIVSVDLTVSLEQLAFKIAVGMMEESTARPRD